jgi:diguanylate cyclase (GGDEF)-like protein/PAS domain S-box-containing protein
VGSEQARLEGQTREITDDLAARLDTYLRAQITALEALATSPALDAGDLERFDQQARALLSKTGIHYVIRDLTGQQVINTRLPWGSPLPRGTIELDRIVVETHQAQVSDLVIGAVTRTPLVLVSVPVLRGDEVRYILNASLSPTAINAIVQQAGISSPYSASVVDEKGFIIARATESETYLGKPHPVAGQATGPQGTWNGVNPQQVPVIGSYRRHQLSGWLVTVGVEKAALEARLRQSLWLLGGLALALTIIAVAGALVGGRRIMRAQHRLSEAEGLYRLLAENTNDMIVRADTASNRLYVSPASRDLLGYTPEELVGTNPKSFVHPDDADALTEKLTSLKQGAVERVRSVHRFRRKDNTWVWVEANFHLVRSASGEPTEIVSSVRDASERMRLEEQLREQATKDGLTRLANRRSFDERLEQEWRRTERIGGSLALVLLDVDHFKSYNDTYGHGQGDECLKAVARVVGADRRVSDCAARIGGEEFCLILPNTDSDGAMRVAQSIRSEIEALGLLHEGNPAGVVTVSIGVAASKPKLSESGAGLLDAADQALYAAKRAGRNRAVSAVSKLPGAQRGTGA